jgi:hypothetical protein
VLGTLLEQFSAQSSPLMEMVGKQFSPLMETVNKQFFNFENCSGVVLRKAVLTTYGKKAIGFVLIHLQEVELRTDGAYSSKE